MNRDTFAGPRAFARHMLEGGRLQLRPLVDAVMAFRGRGIESILFRESCWQVELVVAMPSAEAEMHRHLRCASADLLLNGALMPCSTVEGRDIGAPRRGELVHQLRTIGKGEWHGGAAGPAGLVYLSFQQWDGQPTFISEDWEAWTPAV